MGSLNVSSTKVGSTGGSKVGATRIPTAAEIDLAQRAVEAGALRDVKAPKGFAKEKGRPIDDERVADKSSTAHFINGKLYVRETGPGPGGIMKPITNWYTVP